MISGKKLVKEVTGEDVASMFDCKVKTKGASTWTPKVCRMALWALFGGFAPQIV